MVDFQEHRAHDVAAEVACPHCGAPVAKGLAACWLCFSPLDAKLEPSNPQHSSPAASSRPSPPPSAGGFSLASMMMLVTLVSVVLGVFTIAPGFGVPLAIVAAITWLRTVSVVKYRTVAGAPLTSTEIVLMFLRSVAVTLVILVLVGVAVIAALAAMCTGIVGAAGGNGPDVTTLFAISIAVLVAAVLGIISASRFERRRWHRDHHDPK